MNTREFRISQAEANGDWEEVLSAGELRFATLLDTLSELGTQVSLKRLIKLVDLEGTVAERVKSVTHEFIFPPQPGAVLEPAVPRSADLTPDDKLVWDTKTAPYEDALVSGRFQLWYSGNETELHVIANSLKNSSEPEPAVLAAFEVAGLVEANTLRRS